MIGRVHTEGRPQQSNETTYVVMWTGFSTVCISLYTYSKKMAALMTLSFSPFISFKTSKFSFMKIVKREYFADEVYKTGSVGLLAVLLFPHTNTAAAAF